MPNPYIMKKIILILLAVIACSCDAQKDKKTQDEIVADLISHQFDSLAFNCEVVSVALVDSIFAKMPKDDSIYREMEMELERLSNIRSERLNDYILSDEMESFESILNTLPSTDSIVTAMRNYKKNYRGPLEKYVYRIIVQSDSYELKKDVEGYLYLIDTTLTRVRAVPSDYLRLLETISEREDFLLGL